MTGRARGIPRGGQPRSSVDSGAGARNIAQPQTADQLRAEFGRLLAGALEARGLSQAEFARQVGASAKHVNQVLSGKADVRLATLAYWAFCLGARFKIDLK